MSEETQENSGLNLNDFVVMVKVIDICSKRGAFEGPELKDVGVLRDRLAQFVEANRPPKEENEGEQEEAETEA